MHITVAPIYAVYIPPKQIQVQRRPSREEKIRHMKATGNWIVLPYDTLKNQYGRNVWSKKKILQDGTYAHEKNYFITRKNWTPDEDMDYVYRYHRFEGELPSGFKLRVLRLEGAWYDVKIERRMNGEWKKVYEKELELS